MSLTQFVWSLTGKESEVLDTLIDEIVADEVAAAASELNQIQNNEDKGNLPISSSSDPNQPEMPASPTLPKSFLGYFMGESEVVPVEPVKTDDDIVPTSPKSFLGYFMNESEEPPAPPEAVIPVSPKSFLGYFVNDSDEEPAQPEAVVPASSTSNETAEAPAQPEPAVPSSPFTNEAPLLPGTNDVPVAPSEPGPAIPTPPTSFLGYFSGEAAHDEEEVGGFASFMSHIAGFEEESEEEPPPPPPPPPPPLATLAQPVKLGEARDPPVEVAPPVEQGISENVPIPSYVRRGSEERSHEKFDTMDAEDLVTRLEKGLPVRRSLLSSEVDAKMRLVEATSAMNKLKAMQLETNTMLKITPVVSGDAKAVPSLSARIASKAEPRLALSARSAAKATLSARIAPMPSVSPALSARADPAPIVARAVRKPRIYIEKDAVAVPQARRAAVPLASDALKRPKIRIEPQYIARPAWTCAPVVSDSKSQAGWSRDHKSHHWFIPWGGASPGRVDHFPKATTPALHANRPMPGSATRMSCAVASVEAYRVPRY